MKTTKRPKRIFLDRRGKYYFLVNGKKKYIKVAHPLKKFSKNNMEQKQIVKVIINQPKYYKRLRTKTKDEQALRGKNVIFGKPVLRNMTALPVGFNFDQGKINELSHRVNILSSNLAPLFNNKNTHFPTVEKEPTNQLTIFEKEPVKETVKEPIEEGVKEIIEKPKIKTPLQKKKPKKRKQIPITKIEDLKNAGLDQLRTIAKQVGLKPGARRKPALVKFITEEYYKRLPKDEGPPPLEPDVPDNPVFTRRNEILETPVPEPRLNLARQLQLQAANLTPASNRKPLPSTPAPPPTMATAYRSILARRDAINGNEKEENKDNDEDVKNDEWMEGAGKDDGLYDMEIQKIIADKSKRYVPVISCDQIMSLKKYIKPDGRFAFVMNTDTSSGKGIHWVGIVIDFDDCSINYYDSLADKPTKRTLEDIRKLIMTFQPDCYFKLKVNSTKDQSDASKNCGWFVCHFIIKMLKGKSFSDASLYSKVKNGEDFINRWKKSFV